MAAPRPSSPRCSAGLQTGPSLRRRNDRSPRPPSNRPGRPHAGLKSGATKGGRTGPISVHAGHPHQPLASGALPGVAPVFRPANPGAAPALRACDCGAGSSDRQTLWPRRPFAPAVVAPVFRPANPMAAPRPSSPRCSAGLQTGPSLRRRNDRSPRPPSNRPGRPHAGLKSGATKGGRTGPISVHAGHLGTNHSPPSHSQVWRRSSDRPEPPQATTVSSESADRPSRSA